MADYNFNEDSLRGYGKHYSDSGLMSKIKNVAKKAGQKVIYYALLAYYVLKDPHTSARDRTIIISALGYFILPIDIVPDFIPVVGFSDDLAALAWALKAVYDNITPEIRYKAQTKLRQWFPSVSPEVLNTF